jgi:ABC-type transport system involved in cytochrome bd biosynthesis fused ATPase/permease subunit
MGSSRKIFFFSIFGAIFNTAIVIGSAFATAAVIVGLIYHHPTTPRHLATLALLWAVKAIFNSQFDRWALNQASILKSELRSSITSSSQSVRAIPSTELGTLLIKGTNSLDIYLARFMPQIFGAALTPIAVIATLGILDITSAIIAIITIPLIPFFGALIGRYTNDAVTAKWQSLGMLGKYFEDSLRGIHTLAIFGRSRTQGARIREMGDRYTDETMKVLRISFLSALVLELAATISVALMAVSIGLRLVNSSMEFFPALAVLVLAPEVYFPLRNAASLFHASADGSAALSRLLEVKSEEGERVFNRTGVISSLYSAAWRSPYGGGELPEFSLQRGEGVVIRGGSGLGKTTYLLEKIEELSERGKVAWIPQNPALISGSVREVFALVDSTISDSAIIEYLNQVGLDINQLPNGLDSRIGGASEKSAEISGGQRRRIAIARALAYKSQVIVCDEPTADLDPASATEILQLLTREMKSGKILLAVLHAPGHQIEGAIEIAMVEK